VVYNTVIEELESEPSLPEEEPVDPGDEVGEAAKLLDAVFEFVGAIGDEKEGLEEEVLE